MIVYGPKLKKTVWHLGFSRPEVQMGIDLPWHNHVAVVDEFGNGVTSMDADHCHRVVDGTIRQAKGHGHERKGYADMEQAA